MGRNRGLAAGRRCAVQRGGRICWTIRFATVLSSVPERSNASVWFPTRFARGTFLRKHFAQRPMRQSSLNHCHSLPKQNWKDACVRSGRDWSVFVWAWGDLYKRVPWCRFRRNLCVVRCVVEWVFSRDASKIGRQEMSSVVAEKLKLLRSRAAIRAVDVANMLGTTPETVSRWNQGRAYPRPGKESLLVDLEYIVERLSEFYSDPKTARAWLYSRHKYFNGLRPADLIPGRTYRRSLGSHSGHG